MVAELVIPSSSARSLSALIVRMVLALPPRSTAYIPSAPASSISMPCHRESMASPLTETITDADLGAELAVGNDGDRVGVALVDGDARRRERNDRHFLAFALHRDNQIRTGGDVAKTRRRRRLPYSPVSDFSTKLNVTISFRKPASCRYRPGLTTAVAAHRGCNSTGGTIELLSTGLPLTW